MNELWKDIKGYEGVYQISNNGKVRSFSCSQEPRPLKYKVNVNGYASYTLYNEQGKRTYSAHRLVLRHFQPEGNHALTCDHQDRNKLNNDINNLRYIDRGDNIRRCQADLILCEHKSGESFTVYGTRIAAEKTKTNRGSVAHALKTGKPTRKGWSFRIVDKRKS